MAALSADRKTQWQTSDALSVPVKAAAKIYAGSLVMHAGTGYAIPGADMASCLFRGVAQEQADNTLGADGAINVLVRQNGIFRFVGDSFAITDVGTEVTILYDGTVSKAATTTNDIKCGKIAAVVSATDVWVRIDGYAF